MEGESKSQPQIVLAFNSGSSSLKIGVYSFSGNQEEVLATSAAEALGNKDGRTWVRQCEQFLLKQARSYQTAEEAAEFLKKTLSGHSLPSPNVIGHRVVHGGPRVREHKKL